MITNNYQYPSRGPISKEHMPRGKTIIDLSGFDLSLYKRMFGQKEPKIEGNVFFKWPENDRPTLNWVQDKVAKFLQCSPIDSIELFSSKEYLQSSSGVVSSGLDSPFGSVRVLFGFHGNGIRRAKIVDMVKMSHVYFYFIWTNWFTLYFDNVIIEADGHRTHCWLICNRRGSFTEIIALSISYSNHKFFWK